MVVWGGEGEQRGGDKLLFSQGKAHRAPKLRRNTDAIFRKRGRLWSSSGTGTSPTHAHVPAPAHTHGHANTQIRTCTMPLYCIFTFANQPAVTLMNADEGARIQPDRPRLHPLTKPLCCFFFFISLPLPGLKPPFFADFVFNFTATHIF